MKASDVDVVIAGLAKIVKSALADLQQRVAALESRPVGLSYAGVFEAGRAYARDVGVTHQGSLWVAVRATALEPGTPDSGWQLAVKRGKDAR